MPGADGTEHRLRLKVVSVLLLSSVGLPSFLKSELFLYNT